MYLSMREQALYVIAIVKHCGLWVEAEAAMVAMEDGKLVSDIPVSDAMAMVWSKVHSSERKPRILQSRAVTVDLPS